MEQDTIQTYLTFSLGKEIFAANVTYILNILEIPPITPVPKSPSYMKGVCNLRGSILPIIDTGVKLNMPNSVITKNSAILVINVILDKEQVEAGLLVDSVNEVFEYDAEKIIESPPVGMKYNINYLDGFLKLKNNYFMLLNFDKIFANESKIDLIK